MSKIVLQPSGGSEAQRHYEETIKKRVPLERIVKFISAADASILAELYPDGQVAVWGVAAGEGGINRKKWERLAPGDIVLFAGDKRIYSRAEAVFKTHNESLARDLWGIDSDGFTWEYIFCFKDLQLENISYDALGKVAGYQPGFLVRNFNVLSESRSQKIIETFNLSAYSEKEFLTAVKELELRAQGDIDEKREVLVRKEQGFLRRYLFTSQETGTCSICRNQFPVGLLVASHIKRRAECSVEEKLNYKANVIAMCKLGCDDLFERGYISISKGHILVHSKKKSIATPALRDYLMRLDGGLCQEWNELRQPFFHWHLIDHGFES